MGIIDVIGPVLLFYAPIVTVVAVVLFYMLRSEIRDHNFKIQRISELLDEKADLRRTLSAYRYATEKTKKLIEQLPTE